MRLIDADALIQKRNHAKAYAQDMYVIGQGYVMDAPTANTCEWIKYDYRTMCPKNHGDVDNPYWRIPINMKHLLYCPYCGKKIRQSEQNRDKAYIEAKNLFKTW